MRWSNERYLALVESGVIEEGRGVELIDGQVIESMPQGKLHYLVCLALQRVFEAMGATAQGLSTQPTIILQDGDIYDPEFVLLRPEFTAQDLPHAQDILWVVEVSVTTRRIDLGPKKAAYARGGIPEYWVVDAEKRGVWVFREPHDGVYASERFTPAGEPLMVPVVGATLDTGAVFPKN